MFTVLMNGCTTVRAIHDKLLWNREFQAAEQPLQRGDYDRALKEYAQILHENPEDPPGDRALFHMGVITAHPDNPDRNYTESQRYFRRLIDDFPESDLQKEAEVMVNFMMERIKYEQKLERYLKEYKKYKNQATELENKCKTYEARNEELEDLVYYLKKQLNAFKEIDIETEEKKREDLLRK